MRGYLFGVFSNGEPRKEKQMSNLNKNPVLEFALKMQKELDENKHKGKFSWRKDCSLDYLIKRLYEEQTKL